MAFWQNMSCPCCGARIQQSTYADWCIECDWKELY